MYLTTDHSGLNKFCGPQDENFMFVRPEIQRMIQTAPRKIEERYNCTVHLLCLPNLLFFKAPLTSH